VPAISIVIPCYNEAARLQAAEFQRLAEGPGVHLQFVDDGSSDRTGDLLRQIAQGRPNISVLTLSPNRGKGEAVRRGLLEALGRHPGILGFIDADFSTPVSEVERLLAVMEGSPASVVMGSRVQLLGMHIERYWYRHYFGRVFASAASLILHLPVYDTQCGAKFFRPTPALQLALSEPFHTRWIFDVELIGRLLAGGSGAPPLGRQDFLEVPLQIWRDVKGSKVSLWDVPLVLVQLATIWRALRRWRRERG
jgi:glycosyltransferase involved in cell wall biosynthesis